ncbi:hypothetical protein Z947_1479 [Sulfitobacter geojensis]|nr:hypothetical protein Z947_1479 [Sulfitobacter geojensis]
MGIPAIFDLCFLRLSTQTFIENTPNHNGFAKKRRLPVIGVFRLRPLVKTGADTTGQLIFSRVEL